MKKLCLSVLAFASLFVPFIIFGSTIIEKFSSDPLQNGWQIFGYTNLFQWDSTNQNLAVTWDSSQQNSYFYKPLGLTLTKSNEFLLEFDIHVTDTDAAGFFELAIGLLNFSDATDSNFARGTGTDSPNLAEFDYFPDSGEGFGATLSSTLIDSNNNFAFYEEFSPGFIGLETNTIYHVELLHHAGSTVLTGNIFTNGQIYSSLPILFSFGGVTDFRLDTLAISSFTSTNDPYGDSLLAHGTVDNLVLASPLPVSTIEILVPAQIQFASDTNWLYTLQRTVDLQSSWADVSASIIGTGTNLFLQDTNLPADNAFYRVRANLP